jgi:hypothetical protein
MNLANHAVEHGQVVELGFPENNVQPSSPFSLAEGKGKAREG